jgi:inhibitor of KinA sporulation pathway (predicted exonuclease)
MDLADKKYAIIFDLESTCRENHPAKTKESEIIEIGAAKAALNSFTIIDEFNTFR